MDVAPRILIVDDNLELAENLAEILQTLDQVLASDAVQLLEKPFPPQRLLDLIRKVL